MSKLLIFLCFLVLLSFPKKGAGKLFPDTFDILNELDDELEIEDDEFDLLDLPSWESPPHEKRTIVNVDSFGAVGDGVADDTQAFVNAWKQACPTPNALMLVPKGKTYLVTATMFKGPCEPKFVVQIKGTVLAPNDPGTWDTKSARTWLVFNNLTSFTIQGGGVIEGSGDIWWKNSCKKNKTNPCISAPTAFTIESSSAVRVSRLKIQNAPQMNFIIARSENVLVKNVTVSAPATSPNTDGIHITGSTNVVIQNSNIGTGDDCISIVNGCSNIKMKRINCGPGHGISIGSLGQNNSTGKVERVLLNGAVLNGTTNGLRIKTWQGGSGFVNQVRFQNVQMENVANPIIIDQFYCDSPKSCPVLSSAVAISEIMYRNVAGTTLTRQAIKLACSNTVPCTDVVLNNINLQNHDGTAETYCNSVSGIIKGSINPPANCLLPSDKACNNNEYEAEHVVHTEL